MGFLDDLNASIPVHHHRLLGRQVESIFAEIHSRVEQEADARGKRKRENERLSRIALEARLTGYRKASGNSIPTCTGACGVPSEKLFRVRCRPRMRKGEEGGDDATFHFSLSFFLCISRATGFIKRHRRVFSGPPSR